LFLQYTAEVTRRKDNTAKYQQANHAETRTLAQMYRDWGPPAADRCPMENTLRRDRAVPVKDLSIDQLRRLIQQREGLEVVLPIAIDILNECPLIDHADGYPGDLLLATISTDVGDYWDRNPAQLDRLCQAYENAVRVRTTLLARVTYNFDQYAHDFWKETWPALADWYERTVARLPRDFAKHRSRPQSPEDAFASRDQSTLTMLDGQWDLPPDDAAEETWAIHECRDISLARLTIDQIILLLEHRVGVERIIPIAFDILSADPFVEDGVNRREPGDLLGEVLAIGDARWWAAHNGWARRVSEIFEHAERVRAILVYRGDDPYLWSSGYPGTDPWPEWRSGYARIQSALSGVSE
jgi:hypothetical protein